MKKAFVFSIVVCLFIPSFASAETFEIPLNCSGTYQGPGPSYWEYNFDLGIQFLDIKDVSILWSGNITAAIIQNDFGDTEVVDIQFMAWLGNLDASAKVSGGSSTYPNSESFSEITYFSLRTNHTWNDLLDGQSRVQLEENYLIFHPFGLGHYIEYGKTELNDAILYIEGTPIPEPATLLLFGIGAVVMRRRK